MAVPKRELFKAGDVCEMAGIQPYVLRTWEAEFPALGQAAAGNGGRVYRRADVELVLQIKQLVFGEGLTLAGARRRLDEGDDGEPLPPVSLALGVAPDEVGEDARVRLREIRSGLQGILDLLSGAAAPELRLVAPEAGERRTPTGGTTRSRKSGRSKGQAGTAS
ncbi:MAG: MerR family transcriptional regulator [Vicinamibacterales bacterium]